MILPEWRVEPGLTDYAAAVAAMEARVAAIHAGTAGELIWLVEHPPLYTAGTSAVPADLLRPHDFPVFATGRGGKHTYHGPGQRVVYVLLDLGRRGRDIRRFVAALENWVIAALAVHGVAGRVIAGKVGVWTDTPAGTAKIAAIGVRVRRWVSYHGLAINIDPDLTHFGGIVPCGLPEPVTSLAAIGGTSRLADIDAALAETFATMLADFTTGRDQGT
ncbi:lipoyl(octanoyl) transferase LipB [Polymorphobacter fuscus]|uniref:Octanoyltransferase n=1 Tax=Sandarakinorhabdus fusca TaxID=1439888 RepID=A0A7C9LGF2_9SPHN|nr:lipoyl(octanoyl) transferase LipB [Polymorphobacter fuscus]KAB7646586.1 lipoyl(octanoyl) transferase LipB [Polymorphobacter fuscus]MQT17447.1 lipoyl(octanoyl) transferase LipB [Polymorphobacter fuscus]